MAARLLPHWRGRNRVSFRLHLLVAESRFTCRPNCSTEGHGDFLHTKEIYALAWNITSANRISNAPLRRWKVIITPAATRRVYGPSPSESPQRFR
jgi:hypothetical protein